MTRIFISYSRQDQQFAHRIAQDLTALGADIWIDTDDIPVGMKWSTAIQQGLTSADIMIVIISPNSMGSTNVEDEWQYFLDRKKPLVPVLWQPAEVHFQLSRIEYIDFHTQDYELALRQLHTALVSKGAQLTPITQHDVAYSVPSEQPKLPVRAPIAELAHEPPPAAASPARPTPASDSSSTSSTSSTSAAPAAAGLLRQMPLILGSVIVVLVILVIAGLLLRNGSRGSSGGTTSTGTGTAVAAATQPSTKIAAATTAATAVTGATTAATSTTAPTMTIAASPTTAPIATTNSTLAPTATMLAVVATTAPTIAVPATAAPVAVTTAAATSAALSAGTVRTDAKGVSQVYIPAGCFSMGANQNKDKEAQADEGPQHDVCLSNGFWLDQYEVTNQQFADFIDDGGYKDKQWWTEAGWNWVQSNRVQGPEDYAGFADKQQPRVGINWFEASAYARWRGGVLPTEAQWEYAARGPDSNTYPWGKNWQPGSANINSTGTKPVGSFQDDKSWAGVLDMAGNVSEWVADVYGPRYYDQRIKADPTGPNSGRDRSVRGGSWRLTPAGSRLTLRLSFNPEYRAFSLGFRVLAPQSQVS